jgi:hypothetical protein
MHIVRFITLGFLSTLCLASFSAGAEAATSHDLRPVLVPHKALYDIRLVSRHSGADVLNISGQMLFEGKITCDAWTTDHHFKLIYEYADSPPMQVVSDFTTYEPFNGTDFDFTSRRERNGEVFEELRGHATRHPDGTGKAVYSLPEGLEFDMPAGSLFPAAHTAETVAQMRAGKKIFSVPVFDGSDQEGPEEINTIIGKPVKDVTAAGKAVDAALLESPARAVRMAFFPLNKTEPEADYEMNVVMHDNGVISDMLIDYGDFSVTQKLTALERLENPVCDSKNGKGKQ